MGSPNAPEVYKHSSITPWQPRKYGLWTLLFCAFNYFDLDSLHTICSVCKTSRNGSPFRLFQQIKVLILLQFIKLLNYLQYYNCTIELFWLTQHVYFLGWCCSVTSNSWPFPKFKCPEHMKSKNEIECQYYVDVAYIICHFKKLGSDADYIAKI